MSETRYHKKSLQEYRYTHVLINSDLYNETAETCQKSVYNSKKDDWESSKMKKDISKDNHWFYILKNTQFHDDLITVSEVQQVFNLEMK